MCTLNFNWSDNWFRLKSTLHLEFLVRISNSFIGCTLQYWHSNIQLLSFCSSLNTSSGYSEKPYPLTGKCVFTDTSVLEGLKGHSTFSERILIHLIYWLPLLEKWITIYVKHTLCSQSSASLRSATPDCPRSAGSMTFLKPTYALQSVNFSVIQYQESKWTVATLQDWPSLRWMSDSRVSVPIFPPNVH